MFLNGFFIISFIAVNAIANTIIVPDDYNLIQNAIIVSNEEDTILIRQGTYRESLVIPNRSLTIAGYYLISQDTADIARCRLYPLQGSDSLRCIFADSAAGTRPTLNIIGMTLYNGRTSLSDQGGGIFAIGRNIHVNNCIFDSCVAGIGGALSLRDCAGSFQSVRFIKNGLHFVASILASTNSKLVMSDCEFTQSFSFEEDEVEEQIALNNSSIRIENSRFHDLGWTHHWTGSKIIWAQNFYDSVDVVGCTISNNKIAKVVEVGGQFCNHFYFDSNGVYNNQITAGLYSQDGPIPDTTHRETRFAGNIYRNNYPTPMAGQYGMLNLSGGTLNKTDIINNIVVDNQGGQTSFCAIRGVTGGIRNIKGNRITGNSYQSFSNFKGNVLMIGVTEPEFEENLIYENLEYAVFQGPPDNPQSNAQNNYWGAASGPYDSIGNPTGEGDTVDFRIAYSPWETDTSFLNSANEPRTPLPSSFSLSVYPNPFNSTAKIKLQVQEPMIVRVELFDLLGRRVKELYNAPVLYEKEIFFQADNLSSGVYFVRAKNNLWNRGLATQKILLMK